MNEVRHERPSRMWPGSGATERLQRGIVLASLAAVTALAWLLLAVEHPDSLHAPMHLGTLSIAVALWMAMVVGMMLPPLLPWILGFAALSRRFGGAPVPDTHVFVGGYLIAWGLFSVMAATAQLGVRAGVVGIGLHASPGPTAGAALLLAGAYQLTPFKCSALNHCRSPMSFLLARWENGPAGALRLGWRHGLTCIGCCWALMALSLALGTMSLLWMAGLTVAVGVEKLAPHGRRWSLALGVGLVVCGTWLLGAGSRLAG